MVIILQTRDPYRGKKPFPWNPEDGPTICTDDRTLLDPLERSHGDEVYV